MHRYQTRGRLRLAFDYHSAAEQTKLTIPEQQPPLKVVRAFRTDDGAALAHLHNVSGGVLGGDRLELTIQVGSHAHAQVTTTGATRLYRNRSGSEAAIGLTEAIVRENGLLEYLPDPIIPFAGACYQQQTRIELAAGAGLFWWEIIAPGRVAHGELFAYDLMSTEMEIVADGRIVALERTRLEPHLRPLASLARLGPYRYYASCYICRAGIEATRWLELEARLQEETERFNHTNEVLWAVSTLPAHGLAVRALAHTGRFIVAGLQALWQTARLELYGRAAHPPRKVY